MFRSEIRLKHWKNRPSTYQQVLRSHTSFVQNTPGLSLHSQKLRNQYAHNIEYKWTDADLEKLIDFIVEALIDGGGDHRVDAITTLLRNTVNHSEVMTPAATRLVLFTQFRHQVMVGDAGTSNRAVREYARRMAHTTVQIA